MLPDDGSRVPRHVALLMWGDVIEDFLDPIGWTLDDFLLRMSGGWLFGYVEALARQGIASTLFVFTRDARAPATERHAATGVRVRLLRSPVSYRALRSVIRSPYHWLDGDGRVDIRLPWPLVPLYAVVRDAMPYLATPIAPLVAAIRSESCDAILCQEYEEPRFDAAVAAGAALGIPVFATFQGARARRSRREDLRRPRSIACARGFAVGSSREALRLRDRYAVDPARIVQVFNPVDDATWFPEPLPSTRASLDIPADRTLFAWHGRVAMAQKGLDLLLDAWDLAARESPGLHLLLIGSGEDAAVLARRLAARPASGSVTWVDSYIADRATMRRYLSSADAWILPSRFEGFAVAPLEAMACGLPVIATDVEGIRDIAPNGEDDGIVRVASGDAAALGAAIGRVASDRALRERLRAAGRRRIGEAFGIDAVGRQLAYLLALGRNS